MKRLLANVLSLCRRYRFGRWIHDRTPKVRPKTLLKELTPSMMNSGYTSGLSPHSMMLSISTYTMAASRPQVDYPPAHAHMAGDRRAVMAAVDDEVMDFGFSADRFIDRGIENIVCFRGALRFAQIGGIVLAGAHIKRAGAGHTQTIAGFAQIVVRVVESKSHNHYHCVEVLVSKVRRSDSNETHINHLGIIDKVQDVI